MSNLIKSDKEYKLWIQDIKTRYHRSQIKAAVQRMPRDFQQQI